MVAIRWKYKKLPAQKIFHNDLTTDTLGFFAGLGAGKSHALMMKLLQLSWLNRDMPGGLLCPSVQDFKKDMLPLFQEQFDLHNLSRYCYYHRGDTCFRFVWSKAPMYVFSAEKPIAGPNLAYCGINEPSLIKEIRVNEMFRRVRLKRAPYPQKCMAGTPEDVHGWLQDYVEKHQETGKLRIIQSRTSDNTFIDPEYEQHLKDTLDPLQFRLFAGGEMIFIGTDLFYYAFDSHKNRTEIEFRKDLPFFVNIDFNVGNMTATVCQQYYDRGLKISVFVDEIVIKHEAADTYAMAEAIKARYSDHLHMMTITCDASGKARKTTGPTDVNVLRSYFGHETVRYKSTGNVRLKKRQILVNGLLSKQQILINYEKCPTLKKDMMRVTQKEDYTKDKKNADLTHASDGLDYYCDFEYEIMNKQRFSEYRAR